MGCPKIVSQGPYIPNKFGMRPIADWRQQNWIPSSKKPRTATFVFLGSKFSSASSSVTKNMTMIEPHTMCKRWTFCVREEPQLILKPFFSQFHKIQSMAIYLWRKVVCLFLVVCQNEISQNMVPIVALLVSPWWALVHKVGFIIFRPAMEKLLNIEQFFH
jgi:hypothetical protein